MSSHFVWLNRSKESIALDLKTEAGMAAMQALVPGQTSSSRTSRRVPPTGWAWERRSCAPATLG